MAVSAGMQFAGNQQKAAPVTYDVSFTVLSIFTSLAGCITTLELLHRRTSTKGLYNWFLFIGACVAMGGSGIWSMHFIANRAIVIGDGAPETQIVYSPGFTALSVFLPVLVLLGAFYFLGTNRSRAGALYLVLAGVLTGTAVCGMHYVGNAGIRNYYCRYKAPNVAGAAVIAVAASLIALSVFFRLRERWTDSWYKRTLCAFVLAVAVCGMHWTAAVGTTYIPGPSDVTTGGTTRVQTVIVCAVLSFGCCLVLLIVAFFRGMKTRMAKARAQQVVLACAYFDETGRIMVTQEGNFPCEKITNRYIEKDFGEDELSRSHSTFLWIFRTSRCWSAVRDIIPGMLQYLESDAHARKYQPGHVSPISDASSEMSLSFSGVFKQLFCVTANQLSASLHEALEDIGVLFEEPLETGTLHLFKTSKRYQQKEGLPTKDIESDPFNIGRGKYLFLNRQLSKVRADQYAAMGYRFASIDQVAELVARNMDVKSDCMTAHLERMQSSLTPVSNLLRAVHVACFMVRPSVHQSFDILVPARKQNQLPTVPLKLPVLTTWHKQMLERYDERSIREVLSTLLYEPGRTSAEKDFIFNLHAALLQLLDEVGEMEFMVNAIFSAKPVDIQSTSSNNTEKGNSDKTVLLTVRIMNDIHAKSKPGMRYVPLSFFGAQAAISTNDTAEQARWERRVRSEFGYDTSSSAGRTPISASFWPRSTWHERKPSSSTRTLRNFFPWSPSSWSDGRKNSRATGGSSRRDSGDDQARIVKTIEVEMKEEKDDTNGLGIDGSVDDIARVMSKEENNSTSPSSSSSSGSGPGDHPSHTPHIHHHHEPTTPGIGVQRNMDADFERTQGDRGRYVADIRSTTPSHTVSTSKRARSASRSHGGGKGLTLSSTSTMVKGAGETNVEMVELDMATPSSGNSNGMVMGVRGGWVSDVFGMFRL